MHNLHSYTHANVTYTNMDSTLIVRATSQRRSSLEREERDPLIRKVDTIYYAKFPHFRQVNLTNIRLHDIKRGSYKRIILFIDTVCKNLNK